MTKVRPALDALTAATLARWPEHAATLAKSRDNRSETVLDVSNSVAEIVLKLAHADPGGIDQAVDDYRFLCEEIVLPEELFFRRNGHYRLSTFAQANAEVYENGPFMDRYMNGLLFSNVIWHNHSHAMTYYVSQYLPRLPMGADTLEIGPGHGIFMYFAAIAPNVGSVTGWDLSAASIAKTRHALATLGITRPVKLIQQDMFDVGTPADADMVDSIVMSEILEHVEDPVAAMRSAARSLRPGGYLWVNVPANSPSPDHIFLVNSPEHANQLVRDAGLEVVDSAAYPMLGASLEKAAKQLLSVSCVVTAQKPR
ncbi:MAG: class I SAM-dependent methyltransferase [Polymorphobacter sp.]